MEYVLGIDVGTTGTKSALFNIKGVLLDIEYKSYPIKYPEEGWAEQDPEDWWNALVETVRAVVTRNNEAHKIISIGLSTQGGCLILLDQNFCPLYNAISWMDKRAGEISDQLIHKISVNELYRTCGWPVTDSLNLPTILWFKEKNPTLFKKAKYFASTIDYVNYLLTGKFTIDYTNLALTGFLDLNKKGLSQKTIQIADITENSLPEIVASGKTVGKLTTKAAHELGLSREVMVVSGAHDRYCESIGAGAVATGDCVLGAGTSWVLLATSDKLLFHRDSLMGRGFMRSIFPGLHPLEGKFGLMTVVPYGGNSLKWFRDVIRPGSSFERLNTDASEIQNGSEGLLFVPISSSRLGKGSFLHIDAIHTIKHFTRAVFEGVSFVNRLHLDLFHQAGLKIGKLIMIGGGARSSLWPHIVADVCNTTVDIPELKEAACVGAAVLAATGSGVFNSIQEGCSYFAGKKYRIRPVQKNVDVYNKAFSTFIKYLDCV